VTCLSLLRRSNLKLIRPISKYFGARPTIELETRLKLLAAPFHPFARRPLRQRSRHLFGGVRWRRQRRHPQARRIRINDPSDDDGDLWREIRTRRAFSQFRQIRLGVSIAFPVVVDPVGGGLVDSLARPCGATGFMAFEYSIGGKWLELLKQIAPGVTRAPILRDPTQPAGTGQFGAIRPPRSTAGPARRWTSPSTARSTKTIAPRPGRRDNSLSRRRLSSFPFRCPTSISKPSPPMTSCVRGVYPNAPQVHELSGDEAVALIAFYDSLHSLAELVNGWWEREGQLPVNVFNSILHSADESLKLAQVCVEKFELDRLYPPRNEALGTISSRIERSLSSAAKAHEQHIMRFEAKAADQANQRPRRP
jgi:hypothetical protein